jgi:hypothetical protein
MVIPSPHVDQALASRLMVTIAPTAPGPGPTPRPPTWNPAIAGTQPAAEPNLPPRRR